MNKTIEIPAIHQSDIKKVFKKLGIWKPLKRKELKCTICGEVITFENFSAMKRVKDEIQLICGKGTCFMDFNYK